MIHVEHDADGWEIWTDTQSAARFDGRCIGVGRTLADAKADAVSELRGEIAAVEALTEDERSGRRR